MRWFNATVKITLMLLIIISIVSFIPPFPFEKEPFEGWNKETTSTGVKIQETGENEYYSSQTGGNEYETADSSLLPDDKPVSDEKGTGRGDGKEHDSGYFLTYEEIISLENIGLRDKLVAMSVIRKLSKPELEKIILIAGGGITSEEWPALNDMLEDSLNGKDIKKIKDIIDRNKKVYAAKKLANR